MSGFFLKIGSASTKLIFPFLFAFSTIIMNFYINNIVKDMKNSTMKNISIAIGEMATIIVPKIKSLFTKKTENLSNRNSIIKKKKCLHFFLLFLFFIIYTICIVVSQILSTQINKQSTESHHRNGFYSGESIEALFMTILSIFLLKYKYFIHHKISLLLFILLSISIDFILNNFIFILNVDTNTVIYYLISYLIMLSFDSISLTYQKYMIDVLYYSPYIVFFALGLYLFLFNIYTSLQSFISGTKIFDMFFPDNKVKPILLISLGYIVIRFIYYIFMIFTIFYFTPNHLLISLELAKILNLFISNESKSKYYAIIPIFFQFFSLLIFLEVIELNFCGLNSNTRFNITKREIEEMKEEETRDSLVEIEPGYLVDKNQIYEFEDINDKNNDNNGENNK